MALAMQQASRRNLFAVITAPGFVPADVLERDWDEDAKLKRYSAEPLDWHNSRHWPAITTD